VSELPRVDVGALPVGAAADALERALLDGFDPEGDIPRVASGDFLLMPSVVGAYAGVKVVSVARGNAARGLPVIQGVFVLWEAETLTPVALMDGAALTALRTPAVSLLAIRALGLQSADGAVVFGRGPQGEAHARMIREELGAEDVTILGRADPPHEHLPRAPLVCCCTSAREPIFSGSSVRDDAVFVAVGSHEPDARELDEPLMRAAAVVVESRAAAMREAGDVIQAGLRAESLSPLADVVRGDAEIPTDRPRVFKSVGMAWEDVAVAAAAYETTR
jgi:ornithine cyclodeaminase/alanine dehydrogenase-like protein (mu-crystallin family)